MICKYYYISSHICIHKQINTWTLSSLVKQVSNKADAQAADVDPPNPPFSEIAVTFEPPMGF